MVFKKLSFKTVSMNLLVYGTTHALVDGICAAVVFSILKNQTISVNAFIGLVILYDVLAFGLQAVFGLATDYFESPRATALLGCALTGLSAVIFLHHPIVAIVFAGLGNALFHVGGGSISLNLTPKKATAPGIYVAPGALGLLVGTLLGKSGQFIVWPVILALIVLCFMMFAIKKPVMDYKQVPVKKNKLKYFELILFLVLLSIAIRSLIGSILVFPWKTNIDLLFILTGAVVLGKGLGGILADKLGWIKVAVGALALSIPFLVLGASSPLLAIIGMFLFNITMPITLVTIANILPGRPGFAFGLTCLALLLGVLPIFTSLKQLMGGQGLVLVIITISTLALYYGLRLYSKNYLHKKSAS